MIELTVVVPVFCEERNLPQFLKTLQELLKDCQHEVIFVDDGSTDETWTILRSACESDKNLRCVRLSRNFGKESAICAGLERARGKAVVLLDADFEHPPELIPEMLEIWRQGDVDIVEAVKTFRGKESKITKFGARLFYKSLNLLSGFELSNHTDFKLIDQRVLEAWRKLGERNLFFRGLVHWLGFRRAEVKFSVTATDRNSRWSLWGLIRLAVTGLTSFSSLPLQFISLIGLLTSVPAFALFCHTLWMRFSGQALDGFTTVICLQLMIGSALMLGMGCIGTYVARIHDEVKARPRYIVSDLLGTKS